MWLRVGLNFWPSAQSPECTTMQHLIKLGFNLIIITGVKYMLPAHKWKSVDIFYECVLSFHHMWVVGLNSFIH